jgi:hypothetical protein
VQEGLVSVIRPHLTALAVFVLIAACDEQRSTLTELSQPQASATAAVDSPFYYFRGQRVYLDVDHTQFVVALDSYVGDDVIRTALQSEGVAAREVRPLLSEEGHFLVQLVDDASDELSRSVLRLLRQDPGVKFAASAFRYQTSTVLVVNRLLLRLKDGLPHGVIQRLVSSVGGTILREADSLRPWFEVEYFRDSDPLAVASQLAEYSIVKWAEPDMYPERWRAYSPTDPYYAAQYYLRSSNLKNGVRVDANLEPAWDVVPPYSGFYSVRVAIIDDGIGAHPDLCYDKDGLGKDYVDDGGVTGPGGWLGSLPEA